MPSLTILYTANLQADFDLMPRVFSTIQQVRQSLPDGGWPFVLLDLGGAWSADAWICRATENRAPYLVLDAMGYNVARADGLDRAGIMGLQEAVQLRLLDDRMVYRWQWQDMSVNIGPRGEKPALTWAVPAHDETQIDQSADFFVAEAGKVTLFSQQGELGMVQVTWPDMEAITARRIAFDDHTRPNPTIAAAIEFVEREARFYAQRNQGTLE